MAGPRWKFEDFLSSDEYEFEINPNEGGTPPYAKNMVYQATAAEGGKTLVFEGRDTAPTLTFSGILRSQEQLDELVYWFRKRNQVKLTDDLGREFTVYIVRFSPTRKRAVQARWKHQWEMECVVLDWPDA